ncbi:cingulin-like protein 1 isoform X2 [Manduca sexta]|nr:cingulin-like protein 1 isoform X2 [Manduca sexta]
MKHEEMELEHSPVQKGFKGESITAPSDKVMQLKINWQEMTVQFEKMNNELKDRQKAIMQLYINMRDTHNKMSSLGHKVSLPQMEDLSLMNVTKMTPEQLLQLCCSSDHKNNEKSQRHETQNLSKVPMNIDINRLCNMPTKLVATCEQTLAMRKEIIDWFQTLMSDEKAVSIKTLTKKINEFNGENEMLRCSLERVKAEFLKEINEIVGFLRKGVNETIALQLRTEELTFKVSELNSQNADLRKLIHNADHLKSHTNRERIEELEKELKEEKCKKIVIRNRLTRNEGQMKISDEKAAQLESALKQAQSKTWSLERTVQQLHEQNQKMQTDFDKELNTLTESIKENITHLEEIAQVREKLQSEKKDLEKSLSELSEYYNESLKNIKQELNANIASLKETEQKYFEEVESKKMLQSKVESLSSQLLDWELRYKDISKLCQEKEMQLNKITNIQKELDSTKKELGLANLEIENYRNRLINQGQAIEEIKRELNETIESDKTVKNDLSKKDEYISELEKKLLLLEQQLQESEAKMEIYENQLSSLKNHICKLQEDFGEFDNLSDLHDMINQQRAKLLEATRQNGELAEALQKKDIELDNHIEKINDLGQCLEQRDGVIKMISGKEEEQANIIKLLRNNLEMRAQADTDLTQQLVEKNAEIESLITNVDTRKQQISQLEKIILTLEEQTRRASKQKKADQDKICLLEQKIAELEAYHNITKNNNIEQPADALDSLLKDLENELGGPLDSQLSVKDPEYLIPNNQYCGDRKLNKLKKYECNNDAVYRADHESVPTKIVMGNFVKKTYISSKEDQYKGDNLDRKKAITNMDTQKWITAHGPGINVYADPPSLKENYTPRSRAPVDLTNESFIKHNLQFLSPTQLREEKKCKMFKLAGHRL